MDDLLIKYIEDIKQRNLSSNTFQAYFNDLTMFGLFLKDRSLSLIDVDKLIVMSYVQFMAKSGKADSSIVRSLVAIRNLYKFLIGCGYMKYNDIINYELPKLERNVPQTLSIGEVDMLLSVPDINTDKGLRDKAMLELMYATGIKVTEMLNSNMEDLNTKLNYIKCRGTKEKERIIPFGSSAKIHLENYLSVREKFNINNLGTLFLNNQGEKMSRQGFWKIIKHYAKVAKIEKNINLYTLRHSFAVHMLQNGADMKTVQELLGYTDISAIQLYINLTNKNKLFEVYKNAHPRA